MFCWPCLLFSSTKDKTNWSHTGFYDLNYFSGSAAKHEKSQAHIICMITLKTFDQVRIDILLDHQKQVAVSHHNEAVTRNRNILKRLIDVVCFFGTQELAFRGHHKTSRSINRGNYIELLEFVSGYDEILYAHLRSNSVFKGTSSDIQNDIIDALRQVLISEIENSMYVSIILDETTDITSCSQMSTVLRLVDKHGEVQDRFLFFTDVSKDRSAKAISSHVLKIAATDSFNFGPKLVAQGYDGAAVMSGHLNGTQTRVREIYENARFVHCAAHRLSLVLMQSVHFLKPCKIFFAICLLCQLFLLILRNVPINYMNK